MSKKETMARLPYASGHGQVAELIQARRGGEIHPLDRMLLHSPPVADGWNSLLGAVRERTTLPASVKETVILRIAVLNQADYEWSAHEHDAREAGLGHAQLAAIRDETARDVLSPEQHAALAYADAMTRDVRVPENVFAPLHAHFDHRQIVELTATIGTYNLVSRFLVALEVDLEESHSP